MTFRSAAILVILCAMPFTALHAEPPRTAQIEIDYLLSYIGTSGCSFYRNGSWYEGSLAKAHLRTKYDYLAAHNQIGSAEDFIDKGATKSSISGQLYKIKCGTSPEVASAVWLREALTRFRAADKPDPQIEPPGRGPSY
jgi:hypothetical protein